MGMMMSALVLDQHEVHVAVFPWDSRFLIIWDLGDAGSCISYYLVNMFE